MTFRDRHDAGIALAHEVATRVNVDDEVIVLALARGGVPVAVEVAEALAAPLDVFVVRKLGVPGHEELAMGAIAAGGVTVLNRRVVDGLAISPSDVEAAVERERAEVDRRVRAYRGDRPPPDVHGRTVVLVDDGLATGSTMRAAIDAVRQQEPARIVVAVPVASPTTVEEFRSLADEIVVVETPPAFYAVGQAYEDFTQTTDDEVRDLLSSHGSDH
ncbi:MAG: phosphoribosyltransferase [Actinobacteria bacterium]|nr:phosphoribosyltransferase [Actinomycetota bacterium]